MPAYPDTWYARTLAERRERPALGGTARGDCIVVGGGFAGLFTALGLARGGMRPLVVEAQSVGFGASGRNGGFVSAGYACGAAAIRARVGLERAAEVQALAAEGVEIMRAAIRDLAIPGADPVPGILRLRRHEPGHDLRTQAVEGRLDYLDRAAIRGHLISDRYRHGLLDREAFHIHPLNTLRGIAAEVERLGGQILEGSPARAVTLDGPVKAVETDAGRAEAPRIVIATGGYTGGLVPRLRRAMLPIATYVMVSEEAPDLLASAIRTRHAVGDDRRAGDYYRLVADGRRLLWGGRITTRATDTRGIVRQLRREMLSVYPQLSPLGTELAWSGLMSYARHLMPQIGRLQPCVWYCTAFGGHGLNTTAIGGTVVAEDILGAGDRIAAFAPWGLDWAGGPAGLAAAQLTYWSLQARDRWRERAA